MTKQACARTNGRIRFGMAAIGLFLFVSSADASPVTVASFPKEVIPVEAGSIQFWAKLDGYGATTPITTGAYGGGAYPMLIRLYDPVGMGGIHVIFASNDGGGGGGLSGVMGFIPAAPANVGATGFFWTGITYGDILGACVSCWHKYEIRWNKDGLPGVANGQARVAVFLDDVLNSNYFLINPPSSVFPTFQGGQLDLGYDNTQVTPDTGIVTFDELKIFDGQGNLVLYNTLDSVYAVEHSALGLNGTYLAGSFVPSPFGHALTQAVCDGAVTELSALISSKSGPQNARVWTLTLTNNSYCPADSAQIDGFTLTQTYGAACTPAITAPAAFPLGVGNISGNSTVSGAVTLDFSGCANTARFRATIAFSANNGAVSGSKALNNQFR